MASLTGLNVLLSSLPAGTLLTIWADDNLLRCISPSSRYTTVSLPFPSQPIIGQHTVRVCCYAPGCRYTEATVHVGVPIIHPVP